MNKKCAFLIMVALGVTGLVTDASAADRPGSYLAVKGGFYSPSADFDLGNVELRDSLKGESESGVAAELAFGHYFLPTFALELGIGYFKGSGTYSTGIVTAPFGDADFDVIPVILSAKVLMPIGPVDPYGEVGIGAYFSEFNVSDNANAFEGTTTFGIHAGAGLNVGITENAFIGAEARYVWAEPSFGDQKITLNGDDYDLNGFELNGFTTMLALGYCF